MATTRRIFGIPEVNDSIDASPNFTWSINKIKDHTEKAIETVIDGAPGALDTLVEIAAAIDNQADFYTKVAYKSNVIEKGSIVDYTPSSDFHPVNVKYVLGQCAPKPNKTEVLMRSVEPPSNLMGWIPSLPYQPANKKYVDIEVGGMLLMGDIITIYSDCINGSW